MPLLLRTIDLLFIMRPLLLVPVWGFCVFGYWMACGGDFADFRKMFDLKKIGLFFNILLFSLSVGSVYILNQIADIEVDKKNGGLPLIASSIVSPKIAVVFAVILALFSIGFPLLTAQYMLSVLAQLAVVTGIIYSFRPFYFSGRPFFDFITNAVGYGFIAFAAGWHLGGRDIFTQEMFAAATPYFLLMSAGSISSTLPDYKGDMEEGKKTTAVFLGISKAHLVATLLICIALLLSFFRSDPLTISISAICLPFYLLYIFFKTDLLMESTYKVGGALCMMAAVVVFPLLLPAGLLVFFLTWLYFRLRHGVSYPSLIVVRNDS